MRHAHVNARVGTRAHTHTHTLLDFIYSCFISDIYVYDYNWNWFKIVFLLVSCSVLIWVVINSSSDYMFFLFSQTILKKNSLYPECFLNFTCKTSVTNIFCGCEGRFNFIERLLLFLLEYTLFLSCRSFFLFFLLLDSLGLLKILLSS